MDVSIGRCSTTDIGDVARFIQEHWKPGHILAAHRPLMDWQHRDPSTGSYSFIVARRTRDREILGILGFIPTTRFDPALVDDNVVWLTTWKVRDDARISGLGLAMLAELKRSERHAAIGAVGFNPDTEPIYRALGYHVGELEHFVMPNVRATRAELADLAAWQYAPEPDMPSLVAHRLTQADLLRDVSLGGIAPSPAPVPRKTAAYFSERYVSHPMYEYLVFELRGHDRAEALLACRVAARGDRRALRIVDFAGPADLIARIGPAVQALAQEVDAEYADIYCAGVDRSWFERAGFSWIDPDGPAVVPDHFEPFERRNIRIRYAVATPGGVVRIFKGDSDQDRPNLIPAASR